ncbi:MAG: hypothetical protein RBT70_08730 [Alphaproteobacteria bacterium]|jgi:hypothetical protein|nr:hypothetical protein [Alphaproteobacteria bacterium]
MKQAFKNFVAKHGKKKVFFYAVAAVVVIIILSHFGVDTIAYNE